MPQPAKPGPSPQPPVYRRICAWCRADMGPMWPGSRANSYGICPACIQCYFPDLYESGADEPAAPPEVQQRTAESDRDNSAAESESDRQRWVSRVVGEDKD
jgi:hypothetical protein